MTDKGTKDKCSFIWILVTALCLLCWPVYGTAEEGQSGYPVQAPQKRNSLEIRSKMKGLAKTYREFQEVYDRLDDYPEKLQEALCNNPEMIDFVKGYPSSDGKAHGGFTREELQEKMPLLLQWDTRWGYVPYGNDMIGISGCAPACLSMVILALTGKEEATPDRLASEAEEGGYYTPGQGTSWTFLLDICQKYGIAGEEIMLDKDKVFQELRAGHPIICSMRPGDFTTEGHFIVLTETEGEQIRIHDPNCRTRSSWLWDYDVLASQIKNLWSYSKMELVGVGDQPREEGLMEEKLSQMSLEEKVAQMFLVLPDSFLGIDNVTAAGEAMKNALEEIPVGGLIFMAPNLESEDQIKEMMENLQTYSMDRIGLPMFTGVDEEGGSVARISGTFDVPYIGDMCEVGATGDVSEALQIGRTMGEYLSELGFNLDFAPDADVLSNPDNEVVRYRSFGNDPQLVAEMSMAVAKGLGEFGVYGCLKHFPGHGATQGDTHEGYAYTDKTLEELRQCELMPFEKGAEEGVDFIMAGHISVPEMLGDDTPSSLSYTMITEVLREEFGYDGLVVTDAMNMGAISRNYDSASAAVQAILAGNDVILMPESFSEAYMGVCRAVKEERISEERIDESVRRILRAKQKMMS